jgi:hypothetical protein
MGISLISIANHQILFTGKSQDAIIAIIQAKLNNLELTDGKFLLDFALKWYEDRLDRLDDIYDMQYWFPVREKPEYYDFDTAEFKNIDFDGPCNLRITFDENYILFHDPPFRYKQWFCLENKDGTEAIESRHEWRRYMAQVISLFDGDRVIYLPDMGHPVAKYWWGDDNFEVIEQRLKEDLGEPATTFREVCSKIDNTYFIDRFADLIS